MHGRSEEVEEAAAGGDGEQGGVNRWTRRRFDGSDVNLAKQKV